jgi:hypothetical protein
MDTENISCKKWKIKFCNTLGAEKVPVPQFTRRGFRCVSGILMDDPENILLKYY